MKRFAVYCDESGTGGARYYGFGSLWMAWQRRGKFAADWRMLLEANPFGPCELKWKRVKKQSLPVYRDLVDYFFERSWLAFHCVVVEKAWVNKDLHRGNYDLARRKHLTQFLANKITRCVRTHEGQDTEFRIYADNPFAGSGYGKAHEAAEVIGNNLLAGMLGDLRPIDRVFSCDSKERPGIQLCDVLLGAVLDCWNQGSTNDAKRVVRERIAYNLGWADLNSDTMPDERKFNIWYMCDPRDERRVRTRRVQLRRPLPPLRRYRRGA